VIPAQEKGRSLKPDKHSSRVSSSGRRGQQQKKGRAPKLSDSAIEEEYSQDFSDSLPKEESIIEEVDNKFTSSSGSNSKKLSRNSRIGGGRKDKNSGSKGRRLAKDESESMLTEVIDEESF